MVIVKMKNKKNMNNRGFTLVELIVVLVIMMILAGVTIFAGLGWQDWMQFKHEESAAETIFFAAQNQLVEYDSSGAYEREIMRPLKKGASTDVFNSDLILASSRYSQTTGTMVSDGVLKSISYNNDSKYDWNSIWKLANSSYKGTLNANKDLEDRTIIKLSAKKNDYNEYLKVRSGKGTTTTLSDGTILLFDMISSYISDTSILNGAIALEFSPEVGQVFSVSYSDRVSEFSYKKATSGTDVFSLLDRTLQVREDSMVGYYSVAELSEKLRGRGTEKVDATFEIRNSELLAFNLYDGEGEFSNDTELLFTLYDGDDGYKNTDKVMEFTINYSDIVMKSSGGLEYACRNPLTVTVNFSKGKYRNVDDGVAFRIPVWRDSAGTIHIIMDAADVQAGTSIYENAKGSSDLSTDETPAAKFNNTYSFYRFGLESDVNYIFGSVVVKKDGVESAAIGSSRSVDITAENPTGFKLHGDFALEEGEPCGECTTFYSFKENTDADGVKKRYFDIDNARHLYNVRYETECKSGDSLPNVFTLIKDIDWNDFKNVSGSEGGTNYFLNSYDNSPVDIHVKSGVNYAGSCIATGPLKEDFTDTTDFPFPSFRFLAKDDTFTQAVPYSDSSSEESEDSEQTAYYTISNLDLSFTANVVYGIYDDVILQDIKNGDKTLHSKDAHVKASCLEGDFSALMGLSTDSVNSMNNDILDSSRSNLAMGGAMPLGLFCENMGTISNIVLDKHIVKGMEKLGSNSQLVYTCMVGGFVGNNMGTVDSLTLLDSDADNPTTHINGRKDVGGIVGRQSFVVSSLSSEVTIANMQNYGTVTGMENVGGIVGRAYVNYVGDKNHPGETVDGIKYYKNSTAVSNDKTIPRYMFYHDGYYISDTGISPLSGAEVSRVGKVTIKNSHNRGRVSGDSLLAGNKIDVIKYLEGKADVESKIESYSKDTINARCSFIGGIAGCTADGFVYDDVKDKNEIKDLSGNYIIGQYTDSAHIVGGGDARVNIEYCDSYTEYDEQEILDLAQYGSDSTIATDEIAALSRDYFVGGIVGYARLTAITGSYAKPDDYKDDEVPMTYIFGSRYVGGIAGCSDMSRYRAKGSDSSADASMADVSDIPEYIEGRDYNAVNYNNVIGRMYVGGIAGAFGIGDYAQSTLSFRDPASNEASRPSQVKGDPEKDLANRLLNTGIVLSLKSDYPFGGMTGSYGADNIINSSAAAGACGGVAGALRINIFNGDNIQTEAVKKYMLKLINRGEDLEFDEIDVDSLINIRENSFFGGNLVGGIVGYQISAGHMNRDKVLGSYSLIDAVVYGDNQVGGATGLLENSGGAAQSYNLLPYKADESSSGLLVLGGDIVGGLCGEQQSQICFFKSDKDIIEYPYTVYGRYGVGGLFGRTYSNGRTTEGTLDISLGSQSDRISINGIAYVGGASGVIDLTGKNKFRISLKNMDINARYFAGGFFGASILKGSADSYTYVVNGLIGEERQINADNSVSVNADIFAGGTSGLFWNVGNGYSGITASTAADKKTATGSLIQLADSLNKSSSPAAYMNSTEAFDKIVNGDIKDNNIFIDNNNTEITLSYNDEANKNNAPNVTAELFAGGLFGYVPNGSKVKVVSYSNYSNVHTTGAVSGVYESYSADASYSYMGSLIGRVPSAMTLLNCSNTVAGEYAEDAATYYYAGKASYIGGLTEVNAGLIMGTSAEEPCTNKLDYKYSNFSGGIGAFAGVNGTRVTTGSSEESSSGVIRYVKNEGELRAKTVGGIAAVSGGSSLIDSAVNIGNLKAVGPDGEAGAAGIVYEVQTGVEAYTDIRSCVNAGTIRAASSFTDSNGEDIGNENNTGINSPYCAGIIYNSRSLGVLDTCRNYATGLSNGITSNEDGKKAQSINYCFDTSQASNHIGDIVDTAPTTNMYMNFYIEGDDSSDGEVYSDAGSASDVINIITANNVKFTSFKSEMGSTVDEGYVLYLVKIADNYKTGIDRITYNPIGTEENDYKYDYMLEYDSSIRKDMYQDIDLKYLTFIKSNR